VREKVGKQRLVKEKEKKKWMEYLQQLQDKILVENTPLLESTKDFQVAGTKHKEITIIFSEDKVG